MCQLSTVLLAFWSSRLFLDWPTELYLQHARASLTWSFSCFHSPLQIHSKYLGTTLPDLSQQSYSCYQLSWLSVLLVAVAKYLKKCNLKESCFILRQGFSLNLELTNWLGWLASLSDSVVSASWATPGFSFTWVLGTKLSSLHLFGKSFSGWAISHALRMVLVWEDIAYYSVKTMLTASWYSWSHYVLS